MRISCTNLILLSMQMFLLQCTYLPDENSEKHASELLNLITNYQPTEYHIPALPNLATDSKPLLPDLDENHLTKRTLVLDLDETLIHTIGSPLSSDNWLNIRPGLDEFLKSLSASYELVLWTAGLEKYARKVLKIIDPDNNYFTHLLFNRHCTNGKLKPLTRLNRNMKTTLILDNAPISYSPNPHNGVPIPDFRKEDKVDELYALRIFFEKLATVGEDDVLGIIDSYQRYFKKINQ